MCKATVIFEERLGKRREGWCVYLSKTRDFTWYSDKQVKAKLSAGEIINGIMVNENSEVVQDDSYTGSALLAKTGLATFTRISEDEDGSFGNKYFAVVRVIKNKAGNQYELVTNRAGIEIVSEERLKAMLSLISVGGVQMNEDGSLMIHKGVDVEDATESQNKPQGASKSGKGVS